MCQQQNPENVITFLNAPYQKKKKKNLLVCDPDQTKC